MLNRTGIRHEYTGYHCIKKFSTCGCCCISTISGYCSLNYTVALYNKTNCIISVIHLTQLLECNSIPNLSWYNDYICCTYSSYAPYKYTTNLPVNKSCLLWWLYLTVTPQITEHTSKSHLMSLQNFFLHRHQPYSMY